MKVAMSAILGLAIVLLIAPCIYAQQEISPLREAWLPLIPDEETLQEYESFTSFQLYEELLDRVPALQRQTRRKQFSVRLRCEGVIEAQDYPGNPEIALLHGQYVDEEEIEKFGEHATIGIWTRDFDTLRTLNIGDEFDFVGQIIYKVHHMDRDVRRVPSHGQERDTHTVVAYLSMHLTGMNRDMRIYMVNPRIVPVDDSPEYDDSEPEEYEPGE